MHMHRLVFIGIKITINSKSSYNFGTDLLPWFQRYDLCRGIQSGHRQHGACASVHRLSYRIQVQPCINRRGGNALMIERFADDGEGGAGLGLPASQGAPQIVDPKIIDPRLGQHAPPGLCRFDQVAGSSISRKYPSRIATDPRPKDGQRSALKVMVCGVQFLVSPTRHSARSRFTSA